ncbi:MAG: lipoyl(octanoyl) transferase [Bdellovibrionales bacterium CG12_big_fil_rev_8_21_14_0_65_38_15]|nr:MAG: lipoyl(octanoyl) transferase [Bdellovibrionales bacterium CG22_combo_CG10-13_8_21_14_all_38_13]PIQ54198.1 MAG: lipoyl(octanoyl) transferase [Bdellovibrionales bacterium CG12_big_fil_rev_8_21_14_0_65_38_15]PIR29256.1 MAG: lipoyl(octanoyl) transferase [Bdellovibrionales bacterium CG11_big_fil_rev_8_21_14_0_20_38_13]
MEINIIKELPYVDYLEWLDEASEKTRSDGITRLMVCSHPLVFTMGRGDRQNTNLGLESNFENVKVIPINRGGGLTFHAPNQIIFYPVMKLTSTYGLNEHLCMLAKTFQETLKPNINLNYKRNPLGLWYQEQKLASIGIELKRFVTRHGLAFNLNRIPIDHSLLGELNPCGLSATTYTSLEDLGIKLDWQQTANQLVEHFQTLTKTKL